VVGFLLLAASAVLLMAGSELFAEDASAAGRRFGVAALARPLRLDGRVRVYAPAASAAGVAAGRSLLGGQVNRLWGGLLVVAYLAAVAVVWRQEQRPPAFGEAAEFKERTDRGRTAARHDTRAAGLVLAGVATMAAGGWLAVSGAERIVNSLGLAESVVGLTFVALATTAELFALVWAAFRRRVEELALAGVLGSAIYNATASSHLPVTRIGYSDAEEF
jgi:cation:H+ antiporter